LPASRSDLATDPSLTIQVEYSDGTTTVEQEAVTHPSAGTWEAHFFNLPPGSGTITATCSDGDTAQAAGLTVTNVVTLELPVDGEVLTNPVAVAAGAPPATKKFKGVISPRTNEVYVAATKHGKYSKPPFEVPVNPANGKWSVEYGRLFRHNLPKGRFHFHVMVRHPTNGKRFYASSGRFRLK
jgi:hypothetical protein